MGGQAPSHGRRLTKRRSNHFRHARDVAFTRFAAEGQRPGSTVSPVLLRCLARQFLPAPDARHIVPRELMAEFASEGGYLAAVMCVVLYQIDQHVHGSPGLSLDPRAVRRERVRKCAGKRGRRGTKCCLRLRPRGGTTVQCVSNAAKAGHSSECATHTLHVSHDCGDGATPARRWCDAPDPLGHNVDQVRADRTRVHERLDQLGWKLQRSPCRHRVIVASRAISTNDERGRLPLDCSTGDRPMGRHMNSNPTPRTTATQAERYERFRALHERAQTFIMPNAWDAVSALVFQRAGFEAIGSSSISIAFSLGRPDGAHAVSREDAIANARLLTQVTGLPVNGDLEDGFGPSVEACTATVRAAIDAGLAGLGIEDTTADPAHPIHEFDHAVERVRHAAREARGRILLTGRTDNFLNGKPDLDDTIRRLVAFAEVGADVLFAPGLPDLDAIRQVVRAVAPKPVNVVAGPSNERVTLSALAECGVKRVSVGGALYRRAMAETAKAATALALGDISEAVTSPLSSSEILSWLPR